MDSGLKTGKDPANGRGPKRRRCVESHHLIRLTENLIFRSRKRLNSDCSEAPIQGVPSWYDFYIQYPVVFLFLILNHSQDREERRKENGCEGQNGGQRADG